MSADAERLVGGVKGDEGAGQPPTMTTSSASVSFALFLVFAVAAITAAMSASKWDAKCDQPLQLWLLGVTLISLLSFLMYFGFQASGRDKGGGGEFFIVLLLAALTVAGTSLHHTSMDCDAKAPAVNKTTFATLLGYFILFGLIISSYLGSFGGPFFAIFGNLSHAFFAWLSSLFAGVHDALTEPTAEADLPEKRAATAEFSLYINHTIFLWFFSYIFIEAVAAWNEKCDRRIHRFLTVFGGYGSIMAYIHFLFEKFAGQSRRASLSPYSPYLFFGNLFLYLAWGTYGAHETFSSETCHKDIYRLANLLSVGFLIVCGILGLVILLILLDYCLSGRVRVIMVIEADVKVR